MGLSDKIKSKSDELVADLQGEGADQKASGKVDQKVDDAKDKATDLKHDVQAATDKLKD